MICRILLLISLTSCVSGTFVVNVTQSSYQAEENHNITLGWMFTTKPDSSSTSLNIYCYMVTDNNEVSDLYHVREGVEVPESQDEEFAGRVQCDKNVLREGRIRLHVSRLRTEDSGWYMCDVFKNYDRSSDRCHLNVTVEKKVQTDRPEDDLTTTRAPEVIKSDKPGRNVVMATRVGIVSSLFVIFFLLVGALVLRMCRNDKNCEMMLSGWRRKEEVPVEQTKPDPQQENLMQHAEEKSKDLDSTVGDSDNES